MFAATKAICSKLLPGLNWDPSTCIVRFRTGEGTLVSSRMVPSAEPRVDSYEIDLPENTLVEVDAVEKARIASVVASATGKSVEDLGIQNVARGGGTMGKYVVVVLKEGTYLEGMQVNVPVLMSLCICDIHRRGSQKVLQVCMYRPRLLPSSLTPNKHTTFVSRMFAPLDGITEDQVTGSAHTGDSVPLY
ncbi:hypothetical protein PAXINDRAFT_21789 [Paxillus involutus ATCC 200175]|uniref:Uncharacterized protein n=1 Tax=Paxillus involutus ATCC 200175 TaxID=664439 RepID=A0A0C9T9L0_PAXIN|nr:hypothetical protein PAXINDRAFT_21789 [Paxillus involutus ATCC 200175]